MSGKRSPRTGSNGVSDVVAYLTPAKTLDPYSGLPTSLNWDDVTRTEAPAAFVLNSGSSAETDGQSSTVQVNWTLYIPQGEIEPAAGDRIDVDGVIFVQNGRPLRQRNPFTGWAPYAQVQLTQQGGV